MKKEKKITIEHGSENTGFFTRPFMLKFLFNISFNQGENKDETHWEMEYEIGSYWLILFGIIIVFKILIWLV